MKTSHITRTASLSLVAFAHQYCILEGNKRTHVFIDILKVILFYIQLGRAIQVQSLKGTFIPDTWESVKLSRLIEREEVTLYYNISEPSQCMVDRSLDPFYYSFLVILSLYDAACD